MFDNENNERDLTESEKKIKRLYEKDDKIYKNYFKVSKFLLFLYGQWPNDNASKIYKFIYGFYRWLMIIFSSIIYTIIETGYAWPLFREKKYEALLDNMTHMFTHLLSTYKLYALMLHFDKIKHYCQIFETDVFK